MNIIYSVLYGLLPHVAASEGMVRLITLNNEYQGYGTIMLIVDSIFYMFLFYYFDNIFPNQYGVRKSACFCFKKETRVLQGFEQVEIIDEDEEDELHLDFEMN